MRLIDADAFADFIKNTIKVQKYDALKVNDTTLTVEDVLESIIAELGGTSLDGFKNNPTIEPQRIKGRWIHDGYDIPHGVDWMHCSVCGRREPHVPAAMTNFCPGCGAWMSEELEPEHTMEEFMYGQDLGSPEDGSL